MLFEQAVQIDAPVERVWDIYSDVERWPEWTASVTTVQRLDEGPLRVGSRTRIKQPKLPVATWLVTEYVDYSHFVWVAGGPGVTTTAWHRLEPGADDRGTVATATLKQAGVLGGLVGRLAGNLTRDYLRLETQGLKARAER